LAIGLDQLFSTFGDNRSLALTSFTAVIHALSCLQFRYFFSRQFHACPSLGTSVAVSSHHRRRGGVFTAFGM